MLRTENWELRTAFRYHLFVQGLAERLLKTIRKQESIRAGDRLAVAISGGADSVALLCLLLELRAELGVVLSVAHVNHKLRGEESEEDERFVAKLAGEHGLELHISEAPVDRRRSSDPRSETGSGAIAGIEAAARELRFGFFRQLAREGRVTKIATAHTLDDQAETVLLRMFRGTGIRGLAGIHPRIVFEEQGRAFGQVVRPLLGFRRAALLEFLRERGQGWREDSSNRDMAFLRNRVRHRLLPVIGEEFGEAAIEHMGELAEIARAEEEHWEQWPVAGGQRPVSFEYPVHSTQPTAAPETAAQPPTVAKQVAEKVGFVSGEIGLVSGYRFSDTASSAKPDAPSGAAVRPQTRQAASLPVGPLLALPLAAQRRLVRAWLETTAPDLSISFRRIEEALELAGEPAGRQVEMSSGWKLQRGRQELLLESQALNRRNEADNYEYALPVPGRVEVPELGVRIEAQVVDAAGVAEDARGQLLDLERMPKAVLIRNWRPGDRFWPAHTAAAKKVKELLSDRHATGTEKKLWPVAIAEGCGLVWMRGFPVPASFRAPAGASKVIWIRETAGMM